ncbi:MAG: metal-dependent hydrolase [Thermomicrobium sp.]|nr:metal-dependent hydrolase [Thermomicrobium sp.]
MRDWFLGSAAWLVSVVAHRSWVSAEPGSLRRGLSDAAAHASLALATALPVAVRAPMSARLLVGTLVGALVLDLDHVVAARSVRLRDWMTMPSRPPTHSAFAVGIAVAGALRWNRPFGLGFGLGAISHLVRDLATGGVPLLHPSRTVALPERSSFPLAFGLGALSWWLAGRLAKRQS